MFCQHLNTQMTVKKSLTNVFSIFLHSNNTNVQGVSYNNFKYSNQKWKILSNYNRKF